MQQSTKPTIRLIVAAIFAQAVTQISGVDASLSMATLAQVAGISNPELLRKIGTASARYEKSLQAIVDDAKTHKISLRAASHKCARYGNKQKWCSVEQQFLIYHRFQLAQTPKLRTAMHACARFYGIMHVDWIKCGYYCKKRKVGEGIRLANCFESFRVLYN